MTSFLMALSEEIAELATADEIDLNGMQKGEMINMRNHIHQEINKIHDKELKDQRTDKEKEKIEKRMEKKIKLHPRDIRMLEDSTAGENGKEITTFLDRKKDHDTRAKYKLYVERKTREFERSGKIPLTARVSQPPTTPGSSRVSEETTQEFSIKQSEPEEPEEETPPISPSPAITPSVQPSNIVEKIEMEPTRTASPEQKVPEPVEEVVEEPVEVVEEPAEVVEEKQTPEDELAEAERWYNEECSAYTDAKEKQEEPEEDLVEESISIEPNEPEPVSTNEIIEEAPKEVQVSPATPPLPSPTSLPIIPRLKKPRPQIQTMPCMRKAGEKDPQASFCQRWNPQKPTLSGQNPVSTIHKQRKALRHMEKRDLINAKRKRKSNASLAPPRMLRKAPQKPNKRHRPGPVPGAVISPQKGSRGY